MFYSILYRYSVLLFFSPVYDTMIFSLSVEYTYL